LYNRERENPFEGRLLVCKVAKRIIVFPSEWEVWKRFHPFANQRGIESKV
jgi:hypothetical protein